MDDGDFERDRTRPPKERLSVLFGMKGWSLDHLQRDLFHIAYLIG